MAQADREALVPVTLVGLGADGMSGLTVEARAAIAAADLLVGGRRQLALCANGAAERWPIGGDLDLLLSRVGTKAAAGRRIVVLASGDPLFFGIGARAVAALGAARVRTLPALSCLQLLAAAVGEPWEDAVVASVHSRDLETQLVPIAGAVKAAVLTGDGGDPARVARFLVERGYDDYEAAVGERLGAADAGLTRLPVVELAARRESFDPLNVLWLRRCGDAAARAAAWRQRAPGIEDDLFAQRRPEAGLITKRDVRRLVLARLGLPAVGAADLWDIGTGSGSVAVEMALACPAARVLAIEKNEADVANVRGNRTRSGAVNVRVIHGRAPEAIPPESRPAAVFIGGSGGELPALLETALERLRPGGRLVATFATLEHVAAAIATLKGLGVAPEVAQVQVSEGRPLLDLTRLDPRSPVFVVSAAAAGPARENGETQGKRDAAA